MAHEHQHDEHDHNHPEHPGGPPVGALQFIVAELSPTEALVRYDCPCGCKPSTEYEKDSQESEFEACCCGNVHFVGPNARVDLDHYLAERLAKGEDAELAGYDIHEESVAAPWGGAIPVVYGLPHQSRKH
ncbi:MAG: hypothetical protein EXR58_08635 [Chloroflexi bacterium]|nr:hypothetical protein [Chloroflexota bacterium]